MRDMEQNTNFSIKNAFLSVTASTMGAELKSIQKNGRELLWCGDPAVWSFQAPVLFPLCGSLKNGKFSYQGKDYAPQKHGFARFQPFTLEEIGPEKMVFCLTENEETLAMYPFSFAFRVIYTLEEDALQVTYQVTNTGDEDLYFSVGGHEGYACPGDIETYSLLFEQEESPATVLLDGPLLTYESKLLGTKTKELPLSRELFALDSFIFTDLNSKSVSLKNNKTEETVTLSFEGSDTLLIWGKPDGGFICLEPWCGIPDYTDSDGELTHKKGIIKLSAGKDFSVSHSIK